MTIFRSQGSVIAGDAYPDAAELSDAVTAAQLAETNAKASETSVATNASNASTSATNAATSETNASTSETNSSTSETNAATSASNAATSETNAATSETNAAASVAALPSANMIGNPCFSVNQKGDSGYTGLGPSADQYVQDRWKVFNQTGAGVLTVTTTQVGPGEDAGGSNPITATRLAVTTTDATLGAGDYCILATGVMETESVQHHFQDVTLSFRVRGLGSGTYSLFIQNDALDATYIKEFSVTTSWVKITATIPLTASEGSTWADGQTQGLGIRVGFCLGVGTTGEGTDATWNDPGTNKYGTSGIDNFFATASNWIEFTSIKLEDGSSATAFIPPIWIDEVERCKNYYQQSYDYGVDPGTVDDNGRIEQRQVALSASLYTQMQYSPKFRELPTISIYNPTTGTINSIRNATLSTNLTLSSVVNYSNGITNVIATTSVADTHVTRYQFTARAELV